MDAMEVVINIVLALSAAAIAGMLVLIARFGWLVYYFERPDRLFKLRRRIGDWNFDHRIGLVADRIFGPDLYEKIQASICRDFGHEPTPDHCGIPDHDYCLWCLARTPGEAHPPKLRMDGSLG